MLKIKLSTDTSCLVVVDMINGFVFEGALSDPSIDACTPLICNLIQKYSDAKHPIIAFRDSHHEDSKEFKSFPVHCLKDSHESELIDAIQVYEDKMITLLKNSTNGFVQPQFQNTFEKLLPLQSVVITGCCSDICVLQFALSLQGYINEYNLNTQIIVLEDAVQTFNAPGHSQEDYNKMAFLLMRNAGIQVCNSKEVEVTNE